MIHLKPDTPSTAKRLAIREADERTEGKDEASRLDEARRIIEEYAAELREILRKLRRKMN